MAPSPDIPDEPWIDFSLFGGAESLTEGREMRDKGSRRTIVVSPSEHTESLYGSRQDPNDFLWLMTEEPHRTRRKEIIKAHPEVFKLMGHEPLTKYVALSVVTLQILTAWLLRFTSPWSWKFLLAAYFIGGTANHNLFLAVHEITHNLAFKGIKANKMLAIITNLPIGIPYAITFKGYHLEHHKYLGEDGIDVDLPTNLELFCLNNVLGKVFFCTFQILFYALRPGFVRSQKPTYWHFIGIVVQLSFDVMLVKYVPGGRNMLIYLIMSSFWAGSLHPLAGHFIAEHYVWDGLSQETYSYYGWLNIFAYNVGYHNEHHDFPSIPWTRLPTLRKLAPEFYDALPSHPSWPMIVINFIRDSNVGIYARVKRQPRSGKKNAPLTVELDGGCADVNEGSGASTDGASTDGASTDRASGGRGEQRRRKPSDPAVTDPS
ncbi:fatty acid desaturase-domain-containing protein [Vararia minispora EC-137]|uniref:Fatty acid desaturase-domain-containing protein n=1 Tax=Vararia minispora EC-137 TaxID=1314806 RepID=A0ACB8QAX6_9AGAM|nr:fatty acid desaturase-domain-containing protein [Vararia minispora EC-137]